MKRADTILKEYMKKINDDTLYSLVTKYTQNLSGDLAEMTNILSNDKAVDYYLSTASSADEWYNIIDNIGDYLKKEALRRGIKF